MSEGEIREACGLFGAFGVPEASRVAYYGLFAQQHRGQESAGLAFAHQGQVHRRVGMGLVAEALPESVLSTVPKIDVVIGHVRYSTTGSSSLENAQPLLVRCARGPIAVAHNGNLTNSRALRDELEDRGSIFQGTADSEVMLHLFAQPGRGDVEEHILRVLRRLQGAYSVLFLLPDRIIAARDPMGWRPLWLGSLGPKGTVFASESCAFDMCGATRVREIEPGEMVVVDRNGIRSSRIRKAEPAHCVFEHIYFARPDSTIFGEEVHEVRKAIGRRLAEEQPAPADVVIPIPDSGTPAAIGYAEQSGVPFDLGFVRSHYVGRTFIQPYAQGRAEGVRLKLAPVPSVVRGKRVCVIDDSIVRGTTARSRVRLLYESGASEVHVRISCPPIKHPCYFGIDFPDPQELIANKFDLEGMAKELGAASLGFLSLEGLLSVLARGGDYCTACFSGKYPIPVPRDLRKNALEAR
ncbi:MAG: amidophosphoribosyltransferase [Planctomycetota bacterium]